MTATQARPSGVERGMAEGVAGAPGRRERIHAEAGRAEPAAARAAGLAFTMAWVRHHDRYGDDYGVDAMAM
jgi:hypothetical protein